VGSTHAGCPAGQGHTTNPGYPAAMPSAATPTPRGGRGGARSGLCGSCLHCQEVPNTRGSVFLLCTRSRSDPAYPRYPRLPVLDCPGYQLGGESSSTDSP
jgi:hypothetical protein